MGLAESFLAIPKYTEFSVLRFSARPNTFQAASWASLYLRWRDGLVAFKAESQYFPHAMCF